MAILIFASFISSFYFSSFCCKKFSTSFHVLIAHLCFFSFEFLLLSLSHFLLELIFFLNLCELLPLKDINSLCYMLQRFSPNFSFVLETYLCLSLIELFKASLSPDLLFFSIFKGFCRWCPMGKSSLTPRFSKY